MRRQSEPDALIGRERELDELAGLASRERLITVTGAPGIGKSRLALEIVERGGGGVVVELATLTRDEEVTRAVAGVVSVDEVAGQALVEALVARLSTRPVWLVLDNCEHLLEGCAELVPALLKGCPRLRVLATSREPLGIEPELVWQLGPLAVPSADAASPEALAESAAARLFVDRAAAVEPGFVLNPFVADAVAAICRRLDGIPLAIELAAAHVSSLNPHEIARRLDDSFGFLGKHGAAGLERHETLEAALDWSYQLLATPERRLLERLAVFRGGFELDAVEAVCGGSEIEAEATAALLARLVAKSLVTADPQVAGRYGLLETIRVYAAERLERSGLTGPSRRAHARYYLLLAEQAERELTGVDQQRWLDRLDAELASLRRALEWLLAHGEPQGALRMAGALVVFWQVRCHLSEGRELLQAALAATPARAPAARAKALWGLGFLTVMSGDFRGAIPPLEQSLALYRELGNLQGCARALLHLGGSWQYTDADRTLKLLEESAALARRAGDPWCLALALGQAGNVHKNHGDLSAARPLLEECLSVARRAQDRQGVSWGLVGLGSVCLYQGDYGSAEQLLDQAAVHYRELGEGYGTAVALQFLGDVAFGRGDLRRAKRLYDEAMTLMGELAHPLALLDLQASHAAVAHAEGDHAKARRLYEDAQAHARTHGRTHIPALQGLGQLAAEQGRVAEARRLLEESLQCARARGVKRSTAQALHGLGRLARSEGELKRAAVLYDEALGLWHQAGSAPQIVALVEGIGGLAAEEGRFEDAARLLGAAQSLREQNGYVAARWEASRLEADLTLLRGAFPETSLELALAKGAELKLEDAVALASRGGGRRGRPASGWASLTERERQVAELAAEGLTNTQIADRLFVTLATVKTHLSHIFRKLGVTRRSELARESSLREEGKISPRRMV